MDSQKDWARALDLLYRLVVVVMLAVVGWKLFEIDRRTDMMWFWIGGVVKQQITE